MSESELIKETFFDCRTPEEQPKEVYELVEKATDAALSEFAFEKGWQLSISFVTQEEIRELNRDYRGVDSVTDVLSFPMEESDERGVEILGDIVICVKRAEEQAAEFGHGVTREIAYLSVHSVLHLMGYDHMTEPDRLEMRGLEKQIMSKLKIFKNDREYAD